MEQIKRIPVGIDIFDFTVYFTYETRKGYYREQKRNIAGISREDAQMKFKNWAQQQRTMTNVKILGMEEIKENRQIIEL